VIKALSTSNISLILLTTLFELGIFLILLILSETVSNNINKTAGEVIFYVLYIPNIIILFINSYFIAESYQSAYSLFSLNGDIVVFFFENLMPKTMILVLILAVVVIFFVPRFLPKFKINLNRNQIIFAVMIIFIFLLVIATIFGRFVSNPYLNTIKDELPTLEEEIIIIDKNTGTINFEDLDLSMSAFPENELKYKNIFVFMMEGTLYDKFIEDLNKKGTFYYEHNSNIITFNNYYATNQDSVTAVMTLLSSIFIPYEAYYSEDEQNAYRTKIKNSKNLVSYFNDKNYTTVYSIASVETPPIARDYFWKKVLSLPEETFEENKDLICLHIMEYQRGCEDLILMSDLRETVKNNDKIFMLTEFVFGHGQKYMELSKMSTSEYYDAYLRKFVEILKDENKLDDSIIFMLSDHGYKGMVDSKKIISYHIPAIVYANKIEKETKSEFTSHINFKDLMFNEILVDYSENLNNNYLFLIGSSNTGLFGLVTSNLDYAIAKCDDSCKIIKRTAQSDTNFFIDKLGALLNYKDYFKGSID